MAGEMFVPATGVPALARRRGTLLTSATVESGPDRWQGGFAWRPDRCWEVRPFNHCADDADIYGQPFGPGASEVVYHLPTAIEVTEECRTVQDTDLARVQRQVEASTSFMMARELLTGERTQLRPYTTPEGDAGTVNAYFTDGTATEIAGTYPPSEGLAILEARASEASLNGQVFLHVPPAALPIRDVLHVGDLITSQLGGVIVADAGYDGTDPDGAAPAAGTVWAYATGPVQVRYDAVQTEQWVDWQINRKFAKATRNIAATYDPCILFAIQLAIPDGTP